MGAGLPVRFWDLGMWFGAYVLGSDSLGFRV